MSDRGAQDPLREAFDALREETRDEGPDPSATLRRVLASSRARTRHGAFFWKLGVPLAAVLAVSSAWAAASGRFGRSEPPSAGTSSDRVVEAPSLADSASEASPPTSAGTTIGWEAPRAVDPDVRPTVDVVGLAPPSAPLSASASAPWSDSHPVSSRPLRAGGEPMRGGAASERDPLAEDKSAFEAAYRVYASGTPAAAVAAWDRYLAAHPTGRFVPEARYARAVALARSGDKPAAREALKEFASGEAGSYRREDAVELIDKLQ